MGDVEVPDPRKIRVLDVAGCRRSQEREGRAVVVARDHFREGDVVDAERCADVEDLRRVPRLSLVVGDGDDRIVVGVRVSEIDAPIFRDRDRGIAVRRGGEGKLPYVPGDSVVFGDDHRLVTQAILVREICRPVGADLDVAVESAALRRQVRDDRGPVSQAAVRGQSAVGRSQLILRGDVLRAVVDRVREAGRDRGMERSAAADRLVIFSRVDARSLARDPVITVVGGDG